MNQVTQIFTGKTRPRHIRFGVELEKLLVEENIHINQINPQIFDRLRRRLSFYFEGVRLQDFGNSIKNCIVHQSLIRNPSFDYICEFDLPLSLFNYSLGLNRQNKWKAAAHLGNEKLRSIIVFSEWAKRSFRLHYGSKISDKCEVLYPLSFPMERLSKPINDRFFDFCFIARDFKIKCGGELVKSFARLLEAYPKAKLCVITDLQSVDDSLKRLAPDSIFFFQANLNEKEIARYLNDSRCLVHPTLIDSFGVVCVEALSAGCALITSNIASLPEMNLHNDNGFSFTPPWSAITGDDVITEFGNTQYSHNYIDTLNLTDVQSQLEEYMGLLLSNKHLLEKFMDNSKKLYASKFSRVAWRAKMRNILHSGLSIDSTRVQKKQ